MQILDYTYPLDDDGAEPEADELNDDLPFELERERRVFEDAVA